MGISSIKYKGHAVIETLNIALTFAEFELLIVVLVEEGSLRVGGTACSRSHRPVCVLQ
jgi:hypothetical protein